MLMQRGRSMRWSETDLFYGLKLNMKFEPYASGAESGSGSLRTTELDKEAPDAGSAIR